MLQDRLLHSSPEDVSKTDQRNAHPRSRVIQQRLVDTEKTSDHSRTDQKYHDPPRHQLRPIQKNLNQGTDQSSHPECIEIIHHLSSRHSTMTPCAIPGIIVECLEER